MHATTGAKRVFRTKELLSADKVSALRGRATRVWRCIEIDSAGREFGNPVVLKDAWIDTGRPCEGFVMDANRETLIRCCGACVEFTRGER